MHTYVYKCVVYVVFYCTCKESDMFANCKYVFLHELNPENVNILLNVYCSCLVKYEKELRIRHFLFL